MNGLQLELILCLDRDKTHVLAFHSFGDGFGIDEVVLVRLHEGLHKLRCDQPHIMALLAQLAAQKMCSRTGLQTDERRRHVRGVG